MSTENRAEIAINPVTVVRMFKASLRMAAGPKRGRPKNKEPSA